MLKGLSQSGNLLLSISNNVPDMAQMDGYKATEAIRRLDDQKKANIPIIAMTANTFASLDSLRIYPLGF